MHLQRLSLPQGHHLRAFTGFLLLGAVNTILPFLTNTGSYLTIPFPRHVVVFIETAPAILVKLLFPHLLHRIRPGLRPLLFAAVWAFVTLLTSLLAPNVEVTPRTLICMLGVACAAAGEVAFLAITAEHGSGALSGWGAGTGLGLVACAVGPYTVAFTWDTDLRKYLKNGYYLIAAMVFAYYVIVPKPTRRGAGAGRRDGALEEGQAKKAGGDSRPESSERQRTVPDFASLDTIAERVNLATSLIQPYMVPLALASAMQAMTYPGASRALGASEDFQTFIGFSAAYGLAFQAGNLLGRSSLLVAYYDSFGATLKRLAVMFVLILLNTVFNVVSAPQALFVSVFIAGALCGTLYINVFGKALRDSNGNVALAGLIMGTIGAGESMGLLIGGSIGPLIEQRACDVELGDGERWCHQKW